MLTAVIQIAVFFVVVAGIARLEVELSRRQHAAESAARRARARRRLEIREWKALDRGSASVGVVFILALAAIFVAAFFVVTSGGS